jgi:hypothetical protein
MDDCQEEYQRHIDHLAVVLAIWRAEERMTINDMAHRLNMQYGDVKDALLGHDWKPSLEDVARIEDELSRTVYTIPIDDRREDD